MRPLVLSLALFALVLPVLSRAQSEGESQVPECIRVSQEAPYQGYGYTHIVVLASTCGRAAACEVATNVDPTPVPTRVAAGAPERGVTPPGSPSSAFAPRVRCTLEGR